MNTNPRRAIVRGIISAIVFLTLAIVLMTLQGGDIGQSLLGVVSAVLLMGLCGLSPTLIVVFFIRKVVKPQQSQQ